MPVPPQSGRKSWVTLVAAVIVAGAALWLNEPSEKKLELDIVCEKFIAPMPLTLKLHNGVTELDSLVADGFYGSMSDALAYGSPATRESCHRSRSVS
jgi:hypothetical protein